MLRGTISVQINKKNQSDTFITFFMLALVFELHSFLINFFAFLHSLHILFFAPQLSKTRSPIFQQRKAFSVPSSSFPLVPFASAITHKGFILSTFYDEFKLQLLASMGKTFTASLLVFILGSEQEFTISFLFFFCSSLGYVFKMIFSFDGVPALTLLIASRSSLAPV